MSDLGSKFPVGFPGEQKSTSFIKQSLESISLIAWERRPNPSAVFRFTWTTFKSFTCALCEVHAIGWMTGQDFVLGWKAEASKDADNNFIGTNSETHILWLQWRGRVLAGIAEIAKHLLQLDEKS